MSDPSTPAGPRGEPAAQPPAKRPRSYLLRLWCAETDPCCRASLEDLRTGERLGFASLELLFAYLMEQAEGESDEYRRHLRPTDCGR